MLGDDGERENICRYDWEGEGFKCHVLGCNVSLLGAQKWSSESCSRTVNIYGHEQSEGEYFFIDVCFALSKSIC